jgi:hypothetical protein
MNEVSPEAVPDDLVEVEGQEIVPAPASTLFRTDDPIEVLARARIVADHLHAVIRDQKLYATIKGREHVKVEGWQTLGGMLGVTPVTVWTHKLEDGWEARVEARTLDGRVVGAAEAECLRAESHWRNTDDFALRSMAQTRATSKSLSSVLRFVVTLAGFQGTPAEEMPDEESPAEVPEVQVDAEPVKETPELASSKQQRMIWARIRERNIPEETVKEIFANVAGVAHTERIPADLVTPILDALDDV